MGAGATTLPTWIDVQCGNQKRRGTCPIGYRAPAKGRTYTGKRKRMGEESHDTHQEFWEQYMEVERKELEQRKNGQLGRALGRALPGESQEELDRIAEEDQRKAEE